MNATFAGFVVYLIVVLVVGVIAFRRTGTQKEFVLGDRRLGPWVIAFSERASGESAWLLIGLPGAALALGFLELWTAIGCCSGILFSWLFIARRLRQEVGRYDSLTLPDYFRSRFPETHEAIRFVASLTITFFFTFYVAAQFNAAGKVLDTTFGDMLQQMQTGFASVGVSIQTTTIGMLIGAVIVLFYTTMGGFLAVAWTDLIQGIIMIFTLVVLPIAGFVAISNGTGPESARSLSDLAPELLSLTGGKSGTAAAVAVIGGLSWGLGYMGQPHLLTRFMAINRSSELRKGALIATWWAVPAFWGAFLIGVVGLLMYGPGAFEDPERLMPTLAQTLMPGWLAGIMISGAIAAMMSTADSQLLVTTSTLSEDIYHKLLRRESSPETLALFSRGATLIVGVIAFILAVRSTDLVFTLVSFAWSGLSAAFGPALLLTLWWRRTTGAGVLSGMISGALTVILWGKIPSTWYGLSDPITDRFIGYLVALLVVYAVSLMTQPVREDAAP